MRRFLSIFFFLLKIAVLATIIVWFILNPGKVAIEWQGLVIETSMGFAAALFAAGVFLFALVYHGWRTLLGWPRLWRKQRQLKMTELGYSALNKGLLAIASGDGAAAARHAKKAINLLPDIAMTHLLAAQAAQINKDDISADTHLALLAQHPDGQVFGLRGQISRALQRDDRTEALRLARMAYQQQPEQPWIIDTAVQLEARAKNWAGVEKILRKAIGLKLIDSTRWQSDLVASLLALSDEAKNKGDLEAALECAREALKRGPSFAPAATRVAELWHKKAYRRRAQKTLLEAWENTPHPDLVKSWIMISVGDRDESIMSRVEKLVSANPDNAEAAIAMAEASRRAMLWGIARQHAERAISYRPDRTAFRLMADIERGDTNDNKRVQFWLEKAADAPSAPQWVCRLTHMPFDMWQPLNHQLDFNTIAWDKNPGNAAPSAALLPAA